MKSLLQFTKSVPRLNPLRSLEFTIAFSKYTRDMLNGAKTARSMHSLCIVLDLHEKFIFLDSYIKATTPPWIHQAHQSVTKSSHVLHLSNHSPACFSSWP